MTENHDEVRARPEEYLGADHYTLAEICQELGVDSVWPFVQSLRNHAKSYAEKYYYSFNQNISDDDIISYIQATHKSLVKILNTFKPDIILSPNFVTLPHIMCNHYARKRGIPMLSITGSKVSGVYLFTYQYQDADTPFLTHLRALENGTAGTKNREKAQRYIKGFRERFIEPVSLEAPRHTTVVKRVRRAFSPFYHILRWYLYAPKTDPEGVGVTVDWRPPRVILRDHFAHGWYRRAADGFPYYPLEKIGKCGYFPLQFQPEETIDVVAPRFNNQIETARQVAMSMPGDYTLMVKDHPAMLGRRSPSYLEKVARTPNVKLVDYRIPSQVMLEKADIVISPSSTTLGESAFFNKPAIQLSDLGTTRALPNVMHHSDLTTLSSAIRAMLASNFHTSEYERRLEDYVAATYDVGLEVDYIAIWAGQRPDLLPQLWEAYKKEIARLCA